MAANPNQVPWYLRPQQALEQTFGPQAAPRGALTPPSGPGMAPMPRAFPPAALNAARENNNAALTQINRPGALPGTPLAASPSQPGLPMRAGPSAFGGGGDQGEDDSTDELMPTPPSQGGSEPDNADSGDNGTKGIKTFHDLWLATPKKQKDQQVDQLEQQVGNIDNAYNQLVTKMGERPDTKLTRQDKAELIMEFGLHLMSYSAANRHGPDIGGAAGDAGIDAMSSYRLMKAQKKQDQETYDRTMGAINTARSNAIENARKEDRETRVASASIDKDAAQAQLARAQAAHVGDPKDLTPHWLVHDDKDGNTYAIDPNSNKRVKLGETTDKDRNGKGNRPFEFQTKVDYFMDAYGKDANGNDLTGQARTKVMKKALDFANRTEGMKAGDAYKLALSETKDAVANGRLDGTDQKAVAAYRDDVFNRLHPPSESDADEEQDVTDQFPKGAIQNLPDGKRVKNSKGQTVMRRGDKVYYLGDDDTQ